MNVKIPKIFIKKILIGALLVALSLVVTVVIKESLDTQDPESALPIVTVTYDGAPIPDVYRAAYEWSFFTTKEISEPVIAIADMPISPYDVHSDKDITIDFSSSPSSLRIWRSDNGGTDFTELAIENSAFKSPSTAGMYIYRIRAEWGKGYIEYYFMLDVDKA